MSTKPRPEDSKAPGQAATTDEDKPGTSPGTNATQHQPDPKAEPIPDGEHKYQRRSPYTAGND